MNVFDLINADFATITAPVDVGTNANGSKYGFLIVGADSPQYLAENVRQRNEGLAFRRAVNKKEETAIDRETPEGEARFQERFQANLKAQAMAVTVGWYGFTDAKGKEAPFDAGLLGQMFDKKAGWRDTVLGALNDEARFLPKPAAA